MQCGRARQLAWCYPPGSRRPGVPAQTSCPKARLLSSPPFLNCHSSSRPSHTMQNTSTTVMRLRRLPSPSPPPHSLPLGWQLDLPRSSGRLGKPWQLFAPDPSRAPESQSASHHPLVRPILPVLCRWPLRGQRQTLLKQQGVARRCFNPDSVLIHQATLGPVPSGPETKKRETGGC